MKCKTTLLVLIFGLVGPQAGCTQNMSWSAVEGMIRSSFPEVSQLSTDSLAAWLENDTNPQPTLLDIRTAEEYRVSHLRGAIRVAPDTNDFTFLDSLDRNAPIVTYCSVGYRSSEVAQRMQQAGFTNVSNLEGSIFRWANEGRPVYRGGRSVGQVHPNDKLWGTLLDAELRAYRADEEGH